MEALNNELFRVEEVNSRIADKVVKEYRVIEIKTGKIVFQFSTFIGGDVFIEKAGNVYIRSAKIAKTEHQRKTKTYAKYTKIIFNQEEC